VAGTFVLIQKYPKNQVSPIASARKAILPARRADRPLRSFLISH
jgi:hypothetical protein